MGPAGKGHQTIKYKHDVVGTLPDQPDTYGDYTSTPPEEKSHDDWER